MHVWLLLPQLFTVVNAEYIDAVFVRSHARMCHGGMYLCSSPLLYFSWLHLYSQINTGCQLKVRSCKNKTLHLHFHLTSRASGKLASICSLVKALNRFRSLVPVWIVTSTQSRLIYFVQNWPLDTLPNRRCKKGRVSNLYTWHRSVLSYIPHQLELDHPLERIINYLERVLFCVVLPSWVPTT